MAASPASAQQAAPDPAASSQAAPVAAEDPNDDDIVVTARRREEALQDVPISVSSTSGDQLAMQGTLSLQQLPSPSLNATAPGTNRKTLAFAIRGQRASEVQLLSDPAVGTYFAEVVQPRTYGFGGTLFDLNSVQVLKGVQGTLFGRNVTGGAVLIEPNAPNDTLEGGLIGSIGNYRLRDVEGFVNLPLGDFAALRIAGKTRKRDGYVTEIDTGAKQEDDNYDALRGSLRLRFGPVVSTTIVDWLKANENGSGLIGTDFALGKPGTGITPANFAASCGTSRLTTIGSQQCASLGGVATGIAQQYQASMDRLARNALTYDSGRGGRLDPIDRPLFSNLENWGVTNQTVFTLSDTLSLKNIASYRKIDFSRYQDLDGIPAFLINAIQNTYVEQYSEELQLQGSALGDRLNFTLGGYYFLEDGREDTGPSSQFPELTILGAIAAGAPLNPFTASAAPFVTRDIGIAKATTYAAYAAGTFKLSDTFSVAGGIRYNYDKREATLIPTRGTACTYDPDGAGPGTVLAFSACTRSNQTTDEAVTWDFTLQYEPSDSVTAYASVRRGFRAGGFSLRAKNDGEFTPFQPEFVREYEIGLKNKFRFGGGSLNTTLAAFYQDYTNVQTSAPRLNNGSIITVITNTAAKEHFGGEFEANLAFDNGLTFNGFYSYVDVNVVKLGDPSQAGAFELQGAPHHQLGLNANYRPTSFPEDAGRLAFNANVSYKSLQHLDDRDASADQPGYALVNIAIDWDDVFRSGIGVGLFANNLLDKRYRVGVISLIDTVGIQASLFGEPLTYGARLKFNF